jgi:magnesium-transporting ATPase (P-type)
LLELSVNGEVERYDLLQSLEFTPERKRMSVIVKPKDSEARYPVGFVTNSNASKPFARLYIKGADDKILPLLQHSISLIHTHTHTLSLLLSFIFGYFYQFILLTFLNSGRQSACF